MKKNATERQNNADRYIHAIFCDDIRQEMGNKVSFMGCYQGELLVPFVPLVLPKLCVQVTISTIKERPIKSLTVRLEQGGNQLAIIEVPTDHFARSTLQASADATRWLVSVGVILAPFTIAEPGKLRVVVVTEEGEVLGPGLRLKVFPQVDILAAPLETNAQALSGSGDKVMPKKPAIRKKLKATG